MALVRPLLSRSTYRGWAWLILGGAVLMPYMMAGEVLRILIWGEESEPLTLWLHPGTFLAVLPVVAATGLVLPVRPLLLITARRLLGAGVPDAPEHTDWKVRARTATWYTIHLGVGGVLSGITLALLPMVAVVVVLPLLSAPEQAAGDLLASGWRVGWGPVLGPAALVCLIYLVAGVAAVLRRLAPLLLGPTTAQRLVAEQQHSAQLAARNRLARELHDSVGHALSVVTLQAGAAGRVLDTDPEFARRALSAVEETARRALIDLDHVLGVLREERGEREGGLGEPSERAPQPDLGSLPGLLETSGLTVDARVDADVERLPGGISREAYRIIQEGLTNALRYGADRTATLLLARDPDALTVELVNPLPGQTVIGDPAPGRRGRGLAGVRERASALGGESHAGADGAFWRLRVRLPVRWPA